MNFRHNSWDLNFREPFGALPTGSSVTLRVFAENVSNIKLRTYYKDTERFFDMIPSDIPQYYQYTLTLPQEPDLLWYDFRFDAFGVTYSYGTQDDHLGGEGQIYTGYPPSFQITLYENQYLPPQWYTEGIMYQIFVDRFAKGSTYRPAYFPQSLVHGCWEDSPHYFRDPDGTIRYWDFFGGNLEGIIEKLDYLRSLNVSILYLNPIFESRSNHKYDTADYMKISPEFGDEAAFRDLCAAAESKGIHIILDGVFSHTGDDSRYFNRYGHYAGKGAYQSTQSPYFDWYRFSNYPDDFESWWGITSMPNVEELTPSYQDYIFRAPDSVLNHWMKAGASGWRLDVADELPDAFISNFKAAMLASKPDSVLIGEVWEDASRKIAYDEHRKYFSGRELDAVMNYPFRNTFINFFTGKIDSHAVIRQMMALYEHYPRRQFMGNMNLIGSHDRARVLTLLGDAPCLESEAEKEAYRLSPEQYKTARRRLCLLVLLQMTFPGVPCIYYGDEAGMEGFEDPYNRGPYPWGREDQELLAWYRRVTKLREDHEAFKNGRWYPLASEADLFVYFRFSAGETILCLFNRNTRAFIPFHHDWVKGRTGVDLLDGQSQKLDDILLGPLEARIIRLAPGGRPIFPF